MKTESIYIMGSLPDDRELYYYSHYKGGAESPLETNTVRIFELRNALEEYEKIMSRMKILVLLLGAKKRVGEEYLSLKDEIEYLKDTSRYIYDRIKEYDDNIGGYIYLDKGYEEAKKRFVRVLIPKKK